MSNEIWQLTDRFKFSQGSLSLRTRKTNSLAAWQIFSDPYRCTFSLMCNRLLFFWCYPVPLIRWALLWQRATVSKTHVIHQSSLIFQNLFTYWQNYKLLICVLFEPMRYLWGMSFFPCHLACHATVKLALKFKTVYLGNNQNISNPTHSVFPSYSSWYSICRTV